MFKISFFAFAIVLLLIEDNLNEVNCQSSAKLNIEVYYETLCPDSKRFINNQVSKIYQNSLLQNITNVVLVPYGKASVS
jgi:interferon gamma-inducible protein 30